MYGRISIRVHESEWVLDVLVGLLGFEFWKQCEEKIVVEKILTICDVPGPGRGSSFEEIALLVKDKSRRDDKEN